MVCILLGGFRLAGCLPTDDLDAGFWATSGTSTGSSYFQDQKGRASKLYEKSSALHRDHQAI
jgi:hypothetical protein